MQARNQDEAQSPTASVGEGALGGVRSRLPLDNVCGHGRFELRRDSQEQDQRIMHGPVAACSAGDEVDNDE